MYTKKKIIVFGCGNFGKTAYFKLKRDFDIVAYADNNISLWGTHLWGIQIISPDRIIELCDHETGVVIAVQKYQEIYQQLLEMGITTVLIWIEGFLYHYDERKYLYPYVRKENFAFDISTKSNLKVLFVQVTVCIRTNKIAKLLEENGIEVYLAYLSSSPEVNNKEYLAVYNDIFSFYSMGELINFVNRSNFDIIHSSNTPDFLTDLLTYTNKPIVHDCHDLSSIYKRMTADEMAIEHIANVRSAGVIYTTEGLRNIAVRKFSLPQNKTFVLENLISEELSTEIVLEKISKKDGEIHCVYEGGIVGEDKKSHRYYEEIWMKIAKEKIHIHFYCPTSEFYCKQLESKSEYLHFEGNMSSKELASEMSKYDVGLCVLNVTKKNRNYLEYASPNKIQEYINSGIPVAVGGVDSQIKFVEEYQFGRYLDINGRIREQLEDIIRIKIPKDILKKKKLTMETRIPHLIAFYQNCIERYWSKC